MANLNATAGVGGAGTLSYKDANGLTVGNFNGTFNNVSITAVGALTENADITGSTAISLQGDGA